MAAPPCIPLFYHILSQRLPTITASLNFLSKIPLAVEFSCKQNRLNEPVFVLYSLPCTQRVSHASGRWIGVDADREGLFCICRSRSLSQPVGLPAPFAQGSLYFMHNFLQNKLHNCFRIHPICIHCDARNIIPERSQTAFHLLFCPTTGFIPTHAKP